MTFKDLINEYIHGLSDDDMNMLTHKINWFVEKVKMSNPELVDKFLMKVDLIVNPHFTKETAEYVVSRMSNKDGTTGEHWNYETTMKVMDGDFNEADWYYVLNMIYSDYYKSGRSDETYIGLAKDFMDDKDAPEGKAKRYYKAMRD
ncbi:MAG: hypothetical protein J6W96_04865 [Alphaproteobacteria bacterium]|nr:hypothetical protein [Alphaproteobacteria bacterium]